MCASCNHGIFILLTAIDHILIDHTVLNVNLYTCFSSMHTGFILSKMMIFKSWMFAWVHVHATQSVCFLPMHSVSPLLSLFVFSSLLSLLLLSTSCYLFLFSHVRHPRWRSHWFLPTSSLAAAVLPLPLLTLLYYASNGRSQEIQEKHHYCEWLLLHHVTTLNKSA